VTISATPAGQDSVDIEVTTQDQWSTLVSTIFSQGGGRTIFGGALEEFNLLGLGKQMFAEASHERHEGTTFTFRYSDPQLLGSRWTTAETFISGPFVKSVAAQLIRPFYSLDTKWAGGISASTNDLTLREFDRGQESNRFQRQTGTFQLFANRAIGDRFKKTRLSFSYRFRKRDFSVLPGLTRTIPQDELIHRTALGVRFENIAFVEEKQIDRFLKTEDLTLGSITAVTLGRTGVPIPEGVKRFELSVARREAHRIFRKQYLFAVLSLQTLFEKDTFVNFRLRYYNKLLPKQTFALNVELDFSKDSEIETPFILGGDSGLRGFPAREFSGTRRLLINLENRVFTSFNFLTVAFGGVVFFDLGNVWRASESLDLADLNYSMGVGLRLGYTKSPSSRVGRIDFGWALNRGGEFGVSIGIDQQFSLN
ncbi:MAG: BamA/TamA family outer membrane protein, partial [bacterium]